MDNEYVISYSSEWDTEENEIIYSKQGLTNKGKTVSMHATACDIFNMFENRIEALEDRVRELESDG